jgi:hypothetical protein
MIPGPFAPCKFAEPENHAALVFAQNFDRRRTNEKPDDENRNNNRQSAADEMLN